MNCTFRFLLATLATSLAAADPQLESWQTANTRRYARIYETDAARLAGTCHYVDARPDLTNDAELRGRHSNFFVRELGLPALLGARHSHYGAVV